MTTVPARIISVITHEPNLSIEAKKEEVSPIIIKRGLPPADPTTLELAANFAGAMERWAKAGFATVTAEEYERRITICAACELWDGKARFGLGKCKAPGCGCSRYKAWLKTEICKNPKGSLW